MPSLRDFYRRGTKLEVRDEGNSLGTEFEAINLVGDAVVAIDGGGATAVINVEGTGGGGFDTSKLSDDLVAYYALNELSGDRADSHVNNLTLSVVGSVPGIAGKVGIGAGFGSTTGYFTRAHSPELAFNSGSWSIGFWVKWDTLPPISAGANYEALIAKDSNTANQRDFMIYFEADSSNVGSNGDGGAGIYILLGGSGTIDFFPVVPASSVVEGEWHYVLLVKNSTDKTVTTYFNGSQASQKTYTITENSGSQPLNVGATVVSGSALFPTTSEMDEISIFSKALSVTEASTLYNGGNGTNYLDVDAGTNYAKGDILVNNGSDFVPLPVGANGQSLTANDATNVGLEWRTVEGGSSSSSTLNTSLSNYWSLEEDTILDQPDLVGNLSLQSFNSPSQVLGGGLVASGVQFNGSNSLVNVVSSPQNITTDSRYTYSLWFNSTNNSADQFIYESRADNNLRHQVLYDASLDQVQFLIYGQPTVQSFVVKNSFVPNSQFHHIVISVDEVAGTVEAFFDGQKTINNEAITITTFVTATTNSSIRFGQREAVNDGLIGILDEIGYWSRVLSLNEVTELYRQGGGITFPFPELVVTDGLYEFPRTELGITTSNQSLVDESNLVVEWDTVNKNNAGFFTSSQPSRLRANATGLYHIEVNVVLDNAESDIREFNLFIIKNGNTTNPVQPYPLSTREFNIPAGELATLSLSGEIDLEADDYVEVGVFADYVGTSGDSFLTPSSSNRFSMRRVYASLQTGNQSKGGRLRLASNQTVVSSTPSEVLYTTEVYDTSSFYSINTPYRLVAPENGLMLIDASVEFSTNANGNRTIRLMKSNGTTNVELAKSVVSALSGVPTVVSSSTQDFANEGDEYFVEVLHDAGSNLTLSNNSSLSVSQVVINNEQDQTIIQNLVSTTGASVTLQGNTSFSTNPGTIIPFGVVEVDTNNYVNQNQDRFVINDPGWYVLTSQVINTGGTTAAVININGARHKYELFTNQRADLTSIVYLNKDDEVYISCEISSGTGVVLDPGGVNDNISRFAIASLSVGVVNTTLTAQEEGVEVATEFNSVNFTGNADVSESAGVLTVNIPSLSSIDTREEGVSVNPSSTALNFTGNVELTDDSGTVTINIPSATGIVDAENVQVAATPINYSPTDDKVEDHLEAIDIALANVSGAVIVEEEGTQVSAGATTLDFTGSVNLTEDQGTVTVDVDVLASEVEVTNNPNNYSSGGADLESHIAGIDAALAGAGGGSIEVRDENTLLSTAVQRLDFVGDGVTATELSNIVTVDVPRGAILENRDTLGKGLLSYWKLYDLSGKLIFDHSGNNNSLSPVGAFSLRTDSSLTFLDFDGTNNLTHSVSSESSLTSSTSFSLSGWFVIDSITEFNVLFGAWNPSGNNRRLALLTNSGTGNLLLDYSSDGTSSGFVREDLGTLGDNNIALGTPFHLVLVFDEVSSTFVLYINNQVEVELTTSLNYLYGAVATFGLGYYLPGVQPSEVLDGGIRDVGVWDRVITPVEVSTLYNSGSPLDPQLFLNVNYVLTSQITPVFGVFGGATTLIGANSSENIDISIGTITLLSAIETDSPSTVRVYSSALARAEDSRALGTDPTDQVEGLIAEVQTDVGDLRIDLSPALAAINMDTEQTDKVYLRVFNESAGASVINVSIYGAPLSNFPQATNKGDILVFDGTSYGVLSAGSEGQVLKIDTGQPLGLGWDFFESTGGEGSIGYFGSALLQGARPQVYLEGAISRQELLFGESPGLSNRGLVTNTKSFGASFGGTELV